MQLLNIAEYAGANGLRVVIVAVAPDDDPVMVSQAKKAPLPTDINRLLLFLCQSLPCAPDEEPVTVSVTPLPDWTSVQDIGVIANPMTHAP